MNIRIRALISGMLNAVLKRRATEEPSFRLLTVRGVRPRAGIDLDRPRALETWDDEAEYGHERG